MESMGEYRKFKGVWGVWVVGELENFWKTVELGQVWVSPFFSFLKGSVLGCGGGKRKCGKMCWGRCGKCV